MSEGLTTIISFGGTRTAYILENNQDKPDPGKIDYDDYIIYSFEKIRNAIVDYFVAGGHNLIIQVLDVELFSNKRGQKYIDLSCQYAYELVNSEFQEFYKAHNLDVSFIGIDAIRELDQSHPAKQLGDFLCEFNSSWSYNETRRKLVWNIAAIPLFSIYQQSIATSLDIDMSNLVEAQHEYYRYFSEKIYGFYLPMPEIYIGNNRAGDMPLSTRLPIVIGAKHRLRLFFLPFPTFFMTKQHFDIILADVLGDKREDNTLDYRNDLTQADVKRAHEHYKKMASENNIMGLLTK